MADRFDKALVAQRLKLVEIGVAFIAVLGFCHALGADLVHRAVSVRRDRGAVRPDQIRHPARPSGSARNCRPATRWSKARPSSRSCSAPSSAGLPPRDGGDPAFFALLMIVFALLCWVASLFIPPTGEAAPDACRSVQHRCLDLRSARASARRPAHLVGRVRDELVLARRRGRAVAAAAAGQERARRHRRGRDALPRDFLGRDRGRLRPRRLARGRPHHPAADGDRRRVARRVCVRSRLCDLGPGAGGVRDRASPPCSARCAAFGSRSIWPASRSPAACSSCRCLRRCRPGLGSIAAPAWSPASTCSTPRAMALSTVAIALLQLGRRDHADAVHADRRRQPRRRLSPSAAPCRRAR